MLLGFVAALVLAGGLAVYVWHLRVPVEIAEAQTTLVFDGDGAVLARLYDGQDRTSIPLTDIPKVLQDAVIAAEDRNFYHHRGVDPFGIGRALLADLKRRITGRGSFQGGSTITQQYVKNAFVGGERSVQRKLREAALAMKIERRYSKAEILGRYLNAIYFGRGAYGVEAASRAYFGKSVGSINLAEAAYLAGLIRGPATGDASRHPSVAKRRRQGVLDAMVQTKAIDPTQRDAADAVPLDQSVRPIPTGPGASYERVEAGSPYIVDQVRRELLGRFGEKAVFRGGLRVHTTIDPRLQRSAYDSVYTVTLSRKGDPDGALVALDHGGDVVALVGGRDWGRSKVNLAVRGSGSAGRQAGSTFKPFVLAAALREGISLRSTFDAPAHITLDGAGAGGTAWSVANYDGRSYGPVDLVGATKRSLNTVFAQLITRPEIGPVRVAAMAKRLGIQGPLQPWNAIALGAEDVSPLELAGAYLTFANRGQRRTPSIIRDVRDVNGKILYRRSPAGTSVMRPADADAITDTLVGVVGPGGTGAAAGLGPRAPLAGKTGTTQDHRDAWFVGYTPKRCCVVAVWVGYRDRSRTMSSVHGAAVTGGGLPAQIVRRFLASALDGLDVGRFHAVGPDRRVVLQPS